MAQIEYTIKLRRDTATNWSSNNTILAEGEFGYESDTGRLKIGDGSTPWVSLGYGVAKYTDTFDATTDWGSASGGYYTITITAATHCCGASPTVQLFEESGTDNDLVQVDRVRVNSSGDVSFRVPETPDGRFAGKVVIV